MKLETYILALCALFCTTAHAMEQPAINERLTDDAALRFILTNNWHSLDRKRQFMSDIFVWQRNHPNECRLQKGTLDVLNSIYTTYHSYEAHNDSKPIRYRLQEYGSGQSLCKHFCQGSIAHVIFACEKDDSGREYALHIALELGADINALNSPLNACRKTLLTREMIYNPSLPGRHAQRIKLLLELGARVVVGESNALIEAVHQANPHALAVLLSKANSQITTENLKNALAESQVFLGRYHIEDTSCCRTPSHYEADKKLHVRQTEVSSQLRAALQSRGYTC